MYIWSSRVWWQPLLQVRYSALSASHWPGSCQWPTGILFFSLWFLYRFSCLPGLLGSSLLAELLGGHWGHLQQADLVPHNADPLVTCHLTVQDLHGGSLPTTRAGWAARVQAAWCSATQPRGAGSEARLSKTGNWRVSSTCIAAGVQRLCLSYVVFHVGFGEKATGLRSKFNFWNWLLKNKQTAVFMPCTFKKKKKLLWR